MVSFHVCRGLARRWHWCRSVPRSIASWSVKVMYAGEIGSGGVMQSTQSLEVSLRNEAFDIALPDIELRVLR
jgi:hypothetical protein